MTRAMRLQRGFTLVELMIVILVIAIIASIAVPTYRSFILRAQRSDATAALLRARSAQEKFFLQNRRYMTDADLTALGLNMSEHGFYTVATAPDGARPLPNFALTAAPAAGSPQAQDTKCASFTLDDVGTRGSAPSPIATCWK
jgi:type IV pilus assembly protein PilE